MPARDPDKPVGYYCDAQRPNQPKGTLCSLRAGHGTDHVGTGPCKRHGGSTRNHVKAAQRALAVKACATLGVPIQTGPGEALLQELCETVGNVAFYRALVQQLDAHPAPDERIGEGEDAYYARGEPGVYGRTYHVSGIATGEAKPHVLVQLYNAERKHLKEVSAAALSAGVQDRWVSALENTATTVVQVLTDFATRMGLDPGAEDVREAGRASLLLIAGGSVEGTAEVA